MRSVTPGLCPFPINRGGFWMYISLSHTPPSSALVPLDKNAPRWLRMREAPPAYTLQLPSTMMGEERRNRRMSASVKTCRPRYRREERVDLHPKAVLGNLGGRDP
jgi:hypothetical protein